MHLIREIPLRLKPSLRSHMPQSHIAIPQTVTSPVICLCVPCVWLYIVSEDTGESAALWRCHPFNKFTCFVGCVTYVPPRFIFFDRKSEHTEREESKERFKAGNRKAQGREREQIKVGWGFAGVLRCFLVPQ